MSFRNSPRNPPRKLPCTALWYWRETSTPSALQCTGKLGTYAFFLGQEAIAVGAASAMGAEDVLLPSYRGSAMLLRRGVTMTELLSYWGADERGSDFKTPRKDFPICITIGAQVVHALGVAYAMKLRNEKRVAVARLDWPGRRYVRTPITGVNRP